MKEEWKPIKGFEGLYEVSSIGRVRSLNYRGTGKSGILKPTPDKDGYLTFRLSNKDLTENAKVHRVVANAFIPNPNQYLEINHVDENKSNNSVDNLEWCSRKYNVNYGSAVSRRSKEVLAYDLQGNLVKTFPSTQEAGRQGFTQVRVAACCRGEQNTHKGLVWRYKEDLYEN